MTWDRRHGDLRQLPSFLLRLPASVRPTGVAGSGKNRHATEPEIYEARRLSRKLLNFNWLRHIRTFAIAVSVAHVVVGRRGGEDDGRDGFEVVIAFLAR